MKEIFKTTYLFIYWLTQQHGDQLRSTSTKRQQTANRQQIEEVVKETKQGKQNICIYLYKSKVKKKENVLMVITNSMIDVFNALYSALPQ
jgi:hypothetical protein